MSDLPSKLREHAKRVVGVLVEQDLNRAANELERLRGEVESARRAIESHGGECEKLWKRIEELEAILRRLVERRMGDCFEFVIDDAKAVVGPLESNRHIITTDQIREAWEAIMCNPSAIIRQAGSAFFACFNIFRCKECRGTGDVGLNDCAVGCPYCAEWGSEGWVIKDE